MNYDIELKVLTAKGQAREILIDLSKKDEQLKVTQTGFFERKGSNLQELGVFNKGTVLLQRRG